LAFCGPTQNLPIDSANPLLELTCDVYLQAKVDASLVESGARTMLEPVQTTPAARPWLAAVAIASSLTACFLLALWVAPHLAPGRLQSLGPHLTLSLRRRKAIPRGGGVQAWVGRMGKKRITTRVMSGILPSQSRALFLARIAHHICRNRVRF
jgi:hypothetical protein